MSSFPPSSAPLARHVPLLAGALPLAYYVAAASSHGGYGLEGSFVAAARELSVPYPPGAPISSLLASLFALLPVGPLAFRVSVASALCAAVTLGLFARALLSTLQHIGIQSDRLSAGLALTGSWCLAQSPLFFQQAVRPQVFALQFALSMMVIDALLRFEADEPHGSTRSLYFGAFVQGMCFANHHVLGLLMLPVAAPTLGRLFAHRGFMGLMGHVAAPMLGFSAFIYVPLRLGSGRYGLTDESGLTRVLSMLGREPYWGPAQREAVPALGALRDGLLGSGGGLTLLLSLAAVGLWVTLRSSSRRRFGLLWLIALVLPVASVSLVLEPRLREDAWGALMPSACALIAFAVCGAAVALGTLAVLLPRLEQGLTAGLVGLAALGVVLHPVVKSSAQAALSDHIDDLQRRALAPRAVLFLEDEGSAFRHQGREAEEALRPDLTVLPLGQRNLPHVVDGWAAATPELTEPLRDLVLNGQLGAGSLQSLSAQRPVYVELSDSAPLALFGTALDEGLFARVLPDGVTQGDLRSERAAQAVRLGKLYRAGHSYRDIDGEASYLLGRAHFYQALLRVRLADPEGAHDYCQLSLRSSFVDPRPGLLDDELKAKNKIELERYLAPPSTEPLGQ